MTTQPTDLAARRSERARIRRQAIARAEAEAHRTGRSMTCAETVDRGAHVTCVGATGCLCECHDPAEVTA